MKIVTTHDTVLRDRLLMELARREPDGEELWLWPQRRIDASVVIDAEGQPQCDAVLILGRDLEAEILSACDLGGVRVIGLIAESEDEERLDRLRLRERTRLPLTPEDLAHSLGASAESVPSPVEQVRLRTQSPTSLREGSRPRVIAVWGAKGSPGVTTTALGLAGEAAETGQRAVLVDADVHGASVATLCDILDEAPGIVALSRAAARGNLDREMVDRYAVTLARGNQTFDVVTGITDAQRWPELEPDCVVKVVNFLVQHYDVVIVDVGFSLEADEEISSDLNAPRRNGVTIACLHRADVVVTVATASPVALTRHILALPRLREIIDETPQVTCINRVRDKTGHFASASAVKETLRRFADIPHALIIPDDPETIRRSVASAKPPTWIAPRSPWRQGLTKVWETASA